MYQFLDELINGELVVLTDAPSKLGVTDCYQERFLHFFDSLHLTFVGKEPTSFDFIGGWRGRTGLSTPSGLRDCANRC